MGNYKLMIYTALEGREIGRGMKFSKKTCFFAPL
jgi:hypothetical protein